MAEDVGVRRRGAGGGGEQKRGGGGEERKAERPKPFQGRYNPKVHPVLTTRTMFLSWWGAPMTNVQCRLQIDMDQSPTRAWPSLSCSLALSSSSFTPTIGRSQSSALPRSRRPWKRRALCQCSALQRTRPRSRLLIQCAFLPVVEG